MDTKAVGLETAKLKSIMATAKYEGANETIRQVMDFITSELDQNNQPKLEQLYKFMFDLNRKFNNIAVEYRNKYNELMGDFFHGL